MAVLFSLRPDKSLLDPKFDSYKLSLESLPTYEAEVKNGVLKAILRDQYSLPHLRLYSLHNHLFSDPFNQDVAYFMNHTGSVCKVNPRDNGVDIEDGIWKFPDESSEERTYNPSLVFASETLVTVSSGQGGLYICDTGDRSTSTSWKEVVKMDAAEVFKPSHLISSVVVPGETRVIVVAMLHVDPASEVANWNGKSSSGFLSVVTVVNIVEDASGKWDWKIVARLASQGVLEYAALEPSGKALVVAGDHELSFLLPKQDENGEPKAKEARMEDPPVYHWQQTTEDLTVVFKLPPETKKEDIQVFMDTKHLTVKLTSVETPALKGELWGTITPSDSTWTIHPSEGSCKLELVLTKAETGMMWMELVKGDTRGEQVMDPALVEAVHQRLAHLTSETLVTDESQGAAAYSSQQLEECDDLPPDTSTLARFDLEKVTVSHKASLGTHQWLFNVHSGPGKMPCICLRHDVDGLVWQPPQEASTKHGWPVKHIETFNALGYVQASKESKKFALSAPNFSYAAICDSKTHIYLYRQPSALESELRNRKTGKRESEIAKQQVLSLKDKSEIHGVHASDNNLFVLTSNCCILIKIN